MHLQEKAKVRSFDIVLDYLTCYSFALKRFLHDSNAEAEALLIAMLKAPGSSTAATIGGINALLQMYLEQNLPRDELAAKITALRQLMVRGGMAFDRKGYSLLLEASNYLQDPQVGSMPNSYPRLLTFTGIFYICM